MKIRRASTDDAIAVHGLQVRMQKEGCIWGYQAGSLKALRRLSKTSIIVAEDDGKLIGFITHQLRVVPANAVIAKRHMVCEISDVYVIRGYRRDGVGAKLVRAVLRHSKDQGVSIQYLYSASKRLESVMKWYTRLGFRGWFVTMYRIA